MIGAQKSDAMGPVERREGTFGLGSARWGHLQEECQMMMTATAKTECSAMGAGGYIASQPKRLFTEQQNAERTMLNDKTTGL
jgi:hypothetical protein